MSLIFQKMLFFLYFFYAGVYPFSFAENENLRPNLGGEGLKSERESEQKNLLTWQKQLFHHL